MPLEVLHDGIDVKGRTQSRRSGAAELVQPSGVCFTDRRFWRRLEAWASFCCI